MSQYSEQYKELMNLVISNASETQVRARAKEMKIELGSVYQELQRVVRMVDDLIGQYAPEKDWPTGFIFASAIPQSVKSAGTVVKPTLSGKEVSVEWVVSTARDLVVDGRLETKRLIERANAEGDNRPYRSLAISFGNILSDRGWKRVDTGIYELPKTVSLKPSDAIGEEDKA